MRVVELADELGLRTMDALDLCAFAGLRVSDGRSELSEADVRQARACFDEWRAPASPPAPPLADARAINSPPGRTVTRRVSGQRDRRGLLSQANWSMLIGVGGI